MAELSPKLLLSIMRNGRPIRTNAGYIVYSNNIERVSTSANGFVNVEIAASHSRHKQ